MASRAMIDEFFAQCAMVGLDERAVAQMGLRQKDLEEIDFSDTAMMEARLKEGPLALPNIEVDCGNDLLLRRKLGMLEHMVEFGLQDSADRFAERLSIQLESFPNDSPLIQYHCY